MSKDIYYNELICCRCGRDDSNYSDAGRRLSYAKRCGHSMCQSCLQQTFGTLSVTGRVRGAHAAAKCPAPNCQMTMTVHDYGSKRPEEEEYERELESRKLVRGIYNKPESAFSGDTAAYYAYQEEAEELIATLATGTPKERAAAQAKLDAYVSSHHASISEYRAKRQGEIKSERDRVSAEVVERVTGAAEMARKLQRKRKFVEQVKSTVIGVYAEAIAQDSAVVAAGTGEAAQKQGGKSSSSSSAASKSSSNASSSSSSSSIIPPPFRRSTEDDMLRGEESTLSSSSSAGQGAEKNAGMTDEDRANLRQRLVSLKEALLLKNRGLGSGARGLGPFRIVNTGTSNMQQQQQQASASSSSSSSGQVPLSSGPTAKVTLRTLLWGSAGDPSIADQDEGSADGGGGGIAAPRVKKASANLIFVHTPCPFVAPPRPLPAQVVVTSSSASSASRLSASGPAPASIAARSTAHIASLIASSSSSNQEGTSPLAWDWKEMEWSLKSIAAVTKSGAGVPLAASLASR